VTNPSAQVLLSPPQLGFLFGDLGFSLATIAEMTGGDIAEIRALTRTHRIRRFRGALYWRLSPDLAATIAERIGIEIPGRDWHIQQVHRLLRAAITSAVQDSQIDWQRVDRLILELPALINAEGLSEQNARRVQASRSLGGSYPWLTEQRLRAGLRPRLGGRKRVSAPDV
jgi:hypothetical protein